MAAEKFRASEEAYFRLRGQFDTGRITAEQFDEKLRGLMVQDAQGRYWMPGADSGKWYFYDGLEWVEGDPFASTGSAATAAAVLPAAQAKALPTAVEPARSAPTASGIPEDGARFPLLLLGVGLAVVLCLIAALLVFLNRDRFIFAQLPPAQITPIRPPTFTGLLPTATSEPDFFNTNTPVATPFIPATDIPTREPTTPIAIVIPTQQAPSNIPTITPFDLSTPVPQPPAPATLPPAPATLPPAPTTLPTGRLRVGNGPDARARYIPVSQFFLDGSFNEWSGDEVPLTVPHFGADNWLGPGDLSGSAWVGWNENFLMVAVNVFDDAHVQTQRSWEMFRGDSVELWIDADLEGDFDIAAGNGDDFQFGFSPGDFAGIGPEGVLYIPYRDATVNQQISVAAQANSAGYTLEAVIPWAVLRVQPGQGRVLGYSIDLSDNDVPGTAQQQTQVNHNANFRFQMPATFGNLILE